ncbi:hypothetical protein DZC72_09390 [Maribacter algicola]|uniref:Uncharacterized protein n=1 Tax=Maribacter algicola TaxID=2498892 RepID=A0A3R8R144_9FLAO|nr:hypothetical protein DZC72_09390 [Maribacter algicola]
MFEGIFFPVTFISQINYKTKLTQFLSLLNAYNLTSEFGVFFTTVIPFFENNKADEKMVLII